MTSPTFDLLILTLCVLPPLLLALAGLYRALNYARVGRSLLEAAGSMREARLAIESVRLERALARKFGEEFVRSQPSKVVKFVPRIVSNGVPLHFDNDKGAA